MLRKKRNKAVSICCIIFLLSLVSCYNRHIAEKQSTKAYIHFPGLVGLLHLQWFPEKVTKSDTSKGTVKQSIIFKNGDTILVHDSIKGDIRIVLDTVYVQDSIPYYITNWKIDSALNKYYHTKSDSCFREIDKKNTTISKQHGTINTLYIVLAALIIGLLLLIFLLFKSKIKV